MLLVAHTLDLVGKILISYMAISVHLRVRREHKIDEVVFKQMRTEQFFGMLGIVFMIVAYVLELSSAL